jgi:UDP-2,3-diacylglucosamine pyrophosphatase LpxH
MAALLVFKIFLRIYQQKEIEILLAGHTHHEKERGEIFNQPLLVSPHHSALF